MALRLPLWYILLLLWTFLVKGKATPVCRSLNQARDNDDDDDDDDDDSSSHHRACTTLSPHGISPGSVAGIVIGCLLLLLLLILVGWWCVRRRRPRVQHVGVVAVGAVSPMRENVLLAARNDSQRPAPCPSPKITQPPANTVPTAMLFDNGPTDRRQVHAVNLNDVAPSAESSESVPLPNPYEHDTPPTPPPHDDVVSPITPVSRATSAHSTEPPTSHSHSRSYSYSVAPSAWTYDDSAEPLLSRGTTQASRLTTSSSLHEEIAGYQKALEAHHRKEDDDAQRREERIGQGSAVPEDPPPVYRDREELL